MAATTYEQMILDGIKGLPATRLAEIADFIYFVRKRELQSEEIDDELWAAALREELKDLSRSEGAHLEQELAEYERVYSDK